MSMKLLVNWFLNRRRKVPKLLSLPDGSTIPDEDLVDDDPTEPTDYQGPPQAAQLKGQ